MAEVRLSPAAKRDFIQIGDYTRDRWSKAQAEDYLKQILNVIAQIGTHPFSGHDVAWLRQGYRRSRAGSHLIFYLIRADGVIEIIRILHERMNAAT